LLLLALQGPPRAVQSGAGGFGATAAWLFVASLVSGGVVWLRRRRGAAAWMAVHAGIAVTGYALLLAWDSLG
jgi:CHASE2 domain-containing sensor protein